MIAAATRSGDPATGRLSAGGDRPLPPVAFAVDGAPVTAYAGDTVASALLAAGRGARGRLDLPRPAPRHPHRGRRGAQRPRADPRRLRRVDAARHHRGGQRRAGRHPAAPASASSTSARTRPSTTTMHVHTDVAVVGAGPAGLAAARAAAATGARVDALRAGLPARRQPAGRPGRDRRRRARRRVGRRRARRARGRPRGARMLTRTSGLRQLRRQLPHRPGEAERRSSVARPARASPGSGSGTSPPAGWCWPPARASGRSSSPTTTSPASCSPPRCRPTSAATPSWPAARRSCFTTNDSAYATAHALRAAGAAVTVVDARRGVRALRGPRPRRRRRAGGALRGRRRRHRRHHRRRGGLGRPDRRRGPPHRRAGAGRGRPGRRLRRLEPGRAPAQPAPGCPGVGRRPGRLPARRSPSAASTWPGR